MIQNIDDRDWEIAIDGQPVLHLFDSDGSETFDPTQAFEADVGDELIHLSPGDSITFRLL